MATFGAQPEPAEIAAVIRPYRDLEGPFLPMMHAIQAEYGYVPQAAVLVVADILNITKAEVHGRMTFYHDFRTEKPGRHILRICRSEACQATGGEASAQAVLSKLGVDWHGTTSDGAVTVEPVYCLGLCACGPAAMVDDQVRGRVAGDRIDDLVSEVRA